MIIYNCKEEIDVKLLFFAKGTLDEVLEKIKKQIELERK